MNLNDFSLTTLLCELYSQLYLAGGRTAQKDGKSQLYTDIVDYINWRIRENIKVSEVASYFGYNEKYITTFFKKNAGVSMKVTSSMPKWIWQKRCLPTPIPRSPRLVTTSDFPIITTFRLLLKKQPDKAHPSTGAYMPKEHFTTNKKGKFIHLRIELPFFSTRQPCHPRLILFLILNYNSIESIAAR